MNSVLFLFAVLQSGTLDAVLETAEVANKAWQEILFRSRSPFVGVVNWSDSEDDNAKSPFDLEGVLQVHVPSKFCFRAKLLSCSRARVSVRRWPQKCGGKRSSNGVSRRKILGP